MTDPLLALATITTTVDALLAGAALDYTIKQLPARRRIGIRPYREYFLASDLGNGRFWYIPLGLSAYLLNPAVVVIGYLQNVGASALLPVGVAAGCALLHAFGTSQAVPAGLRFARVRGDDEAVLNGSFDGFARWVVFRGVVGAPMFVAMLLGLVALS